MQRHLSGAELNRHCVNSFGKRLEGKRRLCEKKKQTSCTPGLTKPSHRSLRSIIWSVWKELTNDYYYYHDHSHPPAAATGLLTLLNKPHFYFFSVRCVSPGWSDDRAEGWRPPHPPTSAYDSAAWPRVQGWIILISHDSFFCDEPCRCTASFNWMAFCVITVFVSTREIARIPPPHPLPPVEPRGGEQSWSMVFLM